MDKIAWRSLTSEPTSPKIVASLGRAQLATGVITSRGNGSQAAAVLISPEDLETLEILADRKLMLSLLKAEKDVKAGRIVAHADVFK